MCAAVLWYIYIYIYIYTHIDRCMSTCLCIFIAQLFDVRAYRLLFSEAVLCITLLTFVVVVFTYVLFWFDEMHLTIFVTSRLYNYAMPSV